MRALLPLLLLLATLPAAAHYGHDDCTTSRTVVPGTLVHADHYTGRCQGATASLPFVLCSEHETHLLTGVHVLLLEGDGCQTGVLVETPILP